MHSIVLPLLPFGCELIFSCVLCFGFPFLPFLLYFNCCFLVMSVRNSNTIDIECCICSEVYPPSDDTGTSTLALNWYCPRCLASIFAFNHLRYENHYLECTGCCSSAQQTQASLLL